MKRDMDLVRDILLKVDAAETAPPMKTLMADTGSSSSADFVDYHIRLMVDAGLLSGINATSSSGRNWINLELTWQGHEFLDQIRDAEIWAKAKAGMAKAGGFSIDLLGALAKGLIRKQIEKHTGIEIDL